MPHLSSLHIKKHILYKDFTWDIDEFPLVTIRGKNLDRDEESGNATGKSTLPSCIANILFDAPPSAIKKNSAKESLLSDSDMTLTLSNKRGEYNIRQYMQKQSPKLQIFHDNTNLTLKSITDVKKEIDSIFPMTDDCFYSTVYLNNVRPPVLLNGKPLERLKFFEQVFDQSIYSDLTKLWSSKLTEISKASASYKTLKEEEEELKGSIEKVPLKRLKSVKEKHSQLVSKIRRAETIINKLTAYVSIKDVVKTALDSEEASKRIKDVLTPEIAACETNIQTYTKLDFQNQKAMESRAERTKIKKALKKLPKMVMASLRKEMEERKEKVYKIEALISKFEDWDSQLSQYRKLKAVVKSKGDVAALPTLRKKLSKLEYEVETKSDLKPGKPCPTCGQKIGKDCISDLKKAIAEISRLEKQIQELEEQKELEKLEREIPKVLFKTTLEETRKAFLKEGKELKGMVDIIKKGEEREELEAKLKSLPKAKIDDTDYKKKISLRKKHLSKMVEEKAQLENDIRLIVKLETMDVDMPLSEAKAQLKSKTEWVEKHRGTLDRLAEELSELTTKSARSRLGIERLKAIERKLSSMSEMIANKAIYEELKRACSYKGLMILETQSFAEEYIKKLNSLAKKYFLEPITFEANVDINKFDLTAHRSGGVGDVRTLSGSERGQFIPTSALALLSLIPSDSRCNVMIMDELEGGMSPPEMEVFGKEFIPNVSRSIQNTVIITPKPETIFSITGSKEKLLVRKNKETRWEENW